MSTQLMQGKRGLIMGLANDKSIAWGIAKTCADHGAELAFSYQGDALKKRVDPLAASLGSDIVLPCDVGDEDSIDALFKALADRWGRLDFIVHAIGFSDKNELAWPLRGHQPWKFPDFHGHFGFLFHFGR